MLQQHTQGLPAWRSMQPKAVKVWEARKSKDPENPRLRNGKYAGPNTRIPRLVRGRYAALRLASEARTRRLAEYAAAYSDSAPSTRIPRPRARTRLASEYAARGFSGALPFICWRRRTPVPSTRNRSRMTARRFRWAFVVKGIKPL